MDRKKLIEYLDFRAKQQLIVDDYYRLLGDISIFYVIDEADSFINKLLNIDEDTEEFILNCMSEYATTGQYKIGDTVLIGSEEIADYIIECMG